MIPSKPIHARYATFGLENAQKSVVLVPSSNVKHTNLLETRIRFIYQSVFRTRSKHSRIGRMSDQVVYYITVKVSIHSNAFSRLKFVKVNILLVCAQEHFPSA